MLKNGILKEQWGQSATNYIDDLLTDLQTTQRKRSTTMTKVLDRLRGNYAGAILTLNPGVAIAQAASLPTAGAVLGADTMAAVVPFVKNLSGKQRAALEQEIAHQYGSGSLSMVAEDLGIITDDVRDLMDNAGIPGMKVLLFAFGDGVGSNPYAPHNITRNSVIYTGTHDNNTVRGWWDNEASASDRRRFQSYIGHDIVPDDAAKYMTRLALASVADLAIIPIQDILGLDGSSRMNTPGECRGNWMWRLTQEELEYFASDGSAEAYRLREMNSLYGRCK